VDAWVELAELVNDRTFRQRVRQMAVTGAESAPQQQYDPQPVLEHAGGAVAAGTSPESAEGKKILDRIVDPDISREQRIRLADQLETLTDRRVERYWELMGVLNGRPPFPPKVPAFEWVIAALRAHS
jgi:hypothetical protein